MAYNAVSQADLEVASNATDSDDSHSSSPRREQSFQQLALDHDHMGGSTYLEPAKNTEDSGVGQLESMIRSMTSASYDMVEEDDYEVADHPSTQRRSNSLRRPPPPLDTTITTTTATHPASPEATLRTPITDQPVPLSHPTPDLQSLQGAYLNNVERLERSAERMTSSPTDIGTQIRQIDRESKRRSASSLSSPIATNNDAFSPMKENVSSPHGSILSASRLAQVSEHVPEPRYYGHHADPFLANTQIPNHQQQPDAPYHEDYHYVMENQLERPASAASGDTYQQARILFTDFDGVHFANHDKGDLGRQVSITRPPLASRPQPYKEPQAGENMVYYPAPVPVMLNLPPRLSQKPNLERERRRTQLIKSVSAENRKSAPWISQGETSEQRDKKLSDLPPQLRASAFFESPPATLDIDVKQESAVATLESILDASTYAPVSAFTDHPFAGHLGAEVYGSARPKSSAIDLSSQKRKQASRSTLHIDHRASDSDRADTPHRLNDETEAEAANVHEGTSLHESSRDEGSGAALENNEGDDDQELPFTGPPTTLLAELELRKHELRQRQRTAATSVGLHSTLLQLDAVAQKQSEHRRQRPVTLAWEDPDAHKNDDEADEDVPLGILYPEKGTAADDTRPLGLMERREMEESEPLSRRRARLRGEPAPPPRTPDRRPNTMYSQNIPEPEQPDSGDEGETLAQRLKRLKAKDRTSTVDESEFTTEILAELSHLQGNEEKEKDQGGEVAPEDETLAQRRARLQKEAVEAKRNSTAKIPRYRRSMADILHTRRPTTMGNRSIHETSLSQGGLAHQRGYDARASMHQFPVPSGPPTTSMGFYQNHGRNESSGYGLAHPNTFYSDAILGMNSLSYAAPPGYHARMMMGPEIDSGQREIIDRWRQSIA
ncbi:hypothetical protein FE257_009412 [Aspergillus nanangensis]|uniref:Uncharacterized protein n=1 Tax=Aspergillus nanangensis TaxID=2582783 RepID=A0AAD4CKM4_ASPNN|nr:hypothetical protein FE257_009412 [Aspergillus nanangensis]